MLRELSTPNGDVYEDGNEVSQVRSHLSSFNRMVQSAPIGYSYLENNPPLMENLVYGALKEASPFEMASSSIWTNYYITFHSQLWN